MTLDWETTRRMLAESLGLSEEDLGASKQEEETEDENLDLYEESTMSELEIIESEFEEDVFETILEDIEDEDEEDEDEDEVEDGDWEQINDSNLYDEDEDEESGEGEFKTFKTLVFLTGISIVVNQKNNAMVKNSIFLMLAWHRVSPE